MKFTLKLSVVKQDLKKFKKQFFLFKKRINQLSKKKKSIKISFKRQ